MKFLLDTHAILWWWTEPKRLSRRALAALGAAETEILASSVSAYEIAWKHQLGKLQLPPGLLKGYAAAVADERWKELPLTTEHCLLAGRLESEHRDPFDRLLVAQAISEKAELVSVDPAMGSFEEVKLFW